MTNEEMKKKMVEIIIDAIWKDAEADYDSTDESEARTIADALIAAGIGYIREAEHRAARAERALENACVVILSSRNGDQPRRLRAYYKAYLETAEKELAEEKGGER